jgi:hypothetical protein
VTIQVIAFCTRDCATDDRPIVTMADEKKPKRQRIEESSSSSSAPSMVRTLVDAMTDEDDKKTRELGNALPGSSLVRLLLGPSTIIYNMLLHHEQRRLLQAVQGKKAVAILKAYRSRTFVLDHEWRRSFPRQADDHDLSEAAKWLPNEHQRAVLQKLVIRDVWDVLEQHQGEQLLASLAPLVRELVVQQTIATGGDVLPLDTICTAALRRIRVDQAGPDQGHWNLGRFVQWMRAEKKRSPAFELERFWWNQPRAELRFTSDVRPLLAEWATWKRRPTHLALSVVRFDVQLIPTIVSSLPDLQSLRLRMDEFPVEGEQALPLLQKLPLTDLQLSSNDVRDLDRTAMATTMAAFPRLQQLQMINLSYTGKPPPPDSLALLTELRQFEGPVEFLPTATTAWPLIEGLAITSPVSVMDKKTVEQLATFLNARNRWRWVDILHTSINPEDMNLLVERVPNCPWRYVKIERSGSWHWPDDLKWTLQHSAIHVSLQGFRIARNWIEHWFPTTDVAARPLLRSLDLRTDDLSLSSSDMRQLARAAPYLESLHLQISKIQIGEGEDVKTWCENLAEWPRRFPRLRSMEVSTLEPTMINSHWFVALSETNTSQLPRVRLQFPVAGVQATWTMVAGNPFFFAGTYPSHFMWLDEDSES